MIIKQPETPEEFSEYYSLRWEVLRKHLEQAKGSEKDEFEREAIHAMAIEDGKVIGVGRGHFNSPEKAQIRYMAIDENYRAKGVGIAILRVIESKLKAAGAKNIILNARKSAARFYEKHGYEIVEKGPTLFGKIEHFRMQKSICKS